MNGGLNKWIQCGNATTQIEPQNICKVYNGAKRQNSMVKKFPDLNQGLESGEITLIDSRSVDDGERMVFTLMFFIFLKISVL